jgi:hypothetical protein
MTTDITLFITLIAYSVIVSQSFMYILALRDTSLKMEASNYIQFRKLIDQNMQAKFRYAMYTGLLASVLLIPAAFADGSLVLRVTSIVAFLMLFIDTLVTIKGNLPINSTINAWSGDSYPPNWEEVRARWLQLFQYRQILNITGFIALVAGAVFR